MTRLGCLPLATDREIENRIRGLRSEAQKRSKARGESGFGEEELLITLLDQVAEKIGRPNPASRLRRRKPTERLVSRPAELNHNHFASAKTGRDW